MIMTKYCPTNPDQLSDILGLLSTRQWKAKISELPEIGFMIYESPDLRLIAMGFLRKIEGHMGMIDSFFTHPDAKSELRNVALDMLTTRLIEEAKKQKMEAVVAFSTNDTILTRAEKHGFSATDHKIMAYSFLKG